MLPVRMQLIIIRYYIWPCAKCRHRAIYYGLGCADDPNVDDYYNKSRGFPNTYSPDEDPDVVEEMKIAEAELKRGSGDGTDDDADDANQESSSDGSTDDKGGDSGDDNENDWADEDEEMRDQGLDQSEKRKQKQKVLSCVDKVCIDCVTRVYYY
jgi:hypothetical protein